MNKKLFFLTFLVVPLLINASHFRKPKRYRYEMIYSSGLSNFLGELGGSNNIGTKFLNDLDMPATRPVIGVGLRYKTSPNISLRGTFFSGMLYGNDKLTKEVFRNNRNLHFRSTIIEFGGQVEIYFTREQPGQLYRIKNAKRVDKNDVRIYCFTGASLIFFNPQSKYNDRWVNLQPLGTEGQGIDPEKNKYSRVNIAIPIGLGIKYKLSRRWSIGMETGVRKTFTDYIDDVSTIYYDNSSIQKNKGKDAAYLADPSLGRFPNSTMAGEQRGNPQNKDAYVFVCVNANYRLYHLKISRSRF